LRPEIEWILFCDVDEIFEGEKFGEWLSTFPWQEYEAIRFATYWYFRTASLRATEHPGGPLLVKRSCLTPELLLHPDERSGILHALRGKKEPSAKDQNNNPLVHHYSWVREKQELKRKATSWGHHWERNWQLLIDEEFAKPFSGTDFVRNYTYYEVTPYFDPLEEPLPQKTKHPRPVRKVTARELFRLELESLLNRL
jgi:hypothetical protein